MAKKVDKEQRIKIRKELELAVYEELSTHALTPLGFEVVANMCKIIDTLRESEKEREDK